MRILMFSTLKVLIMYGIVNRAMEDLVRANFGDQKWEAIRKQSGIEIDYFISNEPYDDSITYKLASAASTELDIPLDQVLQTFGKWWILKTGKEKYGGLMEAGGNSLGEFLVNLPVFHSRIMLIYPKLTPPEFKTSNIENNSIHVHYYSKRAGLQEFVRGLLFGLGEMYKTNIEVKLIMSRDEGQDHEVFKVSW